MPTKPMHWPVAAISAAANPYPSWRDPVPEFVHLGRPPAYDRGERKEFHDVLVAVDAVEQWAVALFQLHRIR